MEKFDAILGLIERIYFRQKGDEKFRVSKHRADT